jgi:hypothetical protein
MAVISGHGGIGLGVRGGFLKIRVIATSEWKVMDGKDGDRRRGMGVRRWTWLGDVGGQE